MLTEAQIRQWLSEEEDEHLEFKEARNQYDLKKLKRYCVALARKEGAIGKPKFDPCQCGL